MSRFAIKTPYLIVVISLIIALVGSVSLLRMPVDMFPSMNIPVVVGGDVLQRHAARAN